MKEWIKTCLVAILLLHTSRGDTDDDAADDEAHFDEMGGVSIKVFRGPSRTEGKEVFAPFGYYVKMPVGGTTWKTQPEEEEDENGDGEVEDGEGFDNSEEDPEQEDV